MFLCNMISLLTVTKCQKDNGLCRGDVNDNYKITPLSYDKGATLYLAVSCLSGIRLSARNHQCQIRLIGHWALSVLLLEIM